MAGAEYGRFKPNALDFVVNGRRAIRRAHFSHSVQEQGVCRRRKQNDQAERSVVNDSNVEPERFDKARAESKRFHRRDHVGEGIAFVLYIPVSPQIISSSLPTILSNGVRCNRSKTLPNSHLADQSHRIGFAA